MTKIILVHSFRHGVGRSNILANLAFLLATTGQRVGIIDTDTESPAAHLFFGLTDKDINYSFNDYLLGNCNIEQAAHTISSATKTKGQIFLIPANTSGKHATRHLSKPQDVHLLNAGCQRLINTLNLDVLLIDTLPGISQTPLVTITVSDTLIIVLRLNQHDYQGTSVTMEVVRQLDVPRVVLIVNEAPTTFDFNDVKAKIEQTYKCEVAAILPHVDEVTALANQDIFALRYPQHPLTKTLKKTALDLVI